MKARVLLATALLLLGLGEGWGTPLAPGRGSPHGFMADEERCAGCHEILQDGTDRRVEPHRFSVPVVEGCRECHPEAQMGRSHPVGVAPVPNPQPREGLGGLPLHGSDAARPKVITCGTCHNPHLPRLSSARSYPGQRPWGRTGQFLTYYVRVRGEAPRDGFTALCHACHPGL